MVVGVAHSKGVRQDLFVLLVVPHPTALPRRYLVVEERDSTFYLPAGRVEEGESLVAAAVRETREEAGASVLPMAFVGLDHSATSTGPKLRFVLTARLTVDAPLKSVPDHHGRGARWVTMEDLDKLPLRDGEVRTWIQKAESGRPLLPIEAYMFFS